jgi:hypothetical protein
MAVWSLPLQDGSEGSSFISLTARRSRVFLTQNHHGSLPKQLGLVWDLLLKADPDGPAIIFYAALRYGFQFMLNSFRASAA